MERELSNEVRRTYTYRFLTDEEELIAKALGPEIKKIDKQIERIRNNPKNEGQVTYQVQIEELQDFKKRIQHIIDEFK